MVSYQGKNIKHLIKTFLPDQFSNNVENVIHYSSPAPSFQLQSLDSQKMGLAHGKQICMYIKLATQCRFPLTPRKHKMWCKLDHSGLPTEQGKLTLGIEKMTMPLGLTFLKFFKQIRKTTFSNWDYLLLFKCFCIWLHILRHIFPFYKRGKQAGAELGKTQLKLGLDFTLIICSFGFPHLDW